MKDLYKNTKYKDITAIIIVMISGIIKLLLLHSFALETTEISLLIPVFVIVIICFLQFFFIRLIYREEFFTEKYLKFKNFSREKKLLFITMLGWIVETIVSVMFFLNDSMFKLLLLSEIISFSFIFYYNLLSLWNLKKYEKTYITIILNYGVLLSFVYATSSPSLLSICAFFIIFLISIIYYIAELYI